MGAAVSLFVGAGVRCMPVGSSSAAAPTLAVAAVGGATGGGGLALRRRRRALGVPAGPSSVGVGGGVGGTHRSALALAVMGWRLRRRARAGECACAGGVGCVVCGRWCDDIHALDPESYVPVPRVHGGALRRHPRGRATERGLVLRRGRRARHAGGSSSVDHGCESAAMLSGWHGMLWWLVLLMLV